MTEEREHNVTVAEDGQYTPRRPFENITATHVAAGAWILAAGAYGYGMAAWPNGNYPEASGVFLVLGFGIGVGLAASMVAGTDREGDQE